MVTLTVLVMVGLVLFLRYQFHQRIEDTQMASVMLIEMVAQSVQDGMVIGDYDSKSKKSLTHGVQGSSSPRPSSSPGTAAAAPRTLCNRDAWVPEVLVKWMQSVV